MSGAAIARLVNKDLHVHHIIPKYLVRMLYFHKHNAWLGNDALEVYTRDMPGMLIKRVDHSGADAQGLASIHRWINDAGIPSPPRNVPGFAYEGQIIIDRLDQAYAQWGTPDAWVVGRQWLADKGLLP